MILQRYSTGLWPVLRGERPFIVRGKNFSDWPAVADAIMKTRRADDDREIVLMAAAELMLSESILMALWAPGPVEPIDRFNRSVDELYKQIPDMTANATLVEWHGWDEMISRGFTRENDPIVDLAELMSGVPTASMATSRIPSDELELEELVV